MEKLGVAAVVEGYDAYIKQVGAMQAATDKAAQGIGAAATKAEKGEAAFQKIQKVSLVATAGFVALGGAALKFAVDFEHQMDQVGAVSQASDQEMEQLRKTALKLGADTAFSAGDAAKAMEQLAAGGRSVAQIVGGEAKAAVDLAAAGNYNLADSAKAIATTMDVWKGTTIDTTDVVNRLAGAANVSRFGVDDMAQAIAMGGGVAATAGVSFQDFSTAVAATASSFSSGSDAGTSFKTFLTGLTGNSAQAIDKMKELGIVTADGANAFYDAQGNIRSMADIVQVLHDKIGPLTQEQQTMALKTIFGNDAFRTAASLMKMTGDEFTGMSAKLRDTSAADVAKQRMSNMSGSIEQLKGSLETLGIAIGTHALPMMTALTDKATLAVNGFMALPPSTQGLVLGLTAMAVAAPAAIGGIEKAIGAVKGLGAAAQTTKGQLGLAAVGIAALAIAADAILVKTSGHGLLEWIFGDPSRADAAAEVTEKMAARLQTLGPNADAAAEALKALAAAEERHQTATDILLQQGAKDLDQWKLNTAQRRAAGQATSEEKGAVEGLAQALVAANAPFGKFREAHELLTGDLQKVFDSTVNYQTRLGAFTAVEMKAADDKMLALWHSTHDVSEATGTLAAKTVDSRDAFEKQLDSLEKEEDKLKAVKDALDHLIQAFAEANPAVHELALSNAFLTEELEDLKAKTTPLTAAEEARVKVLEAAIEKNDKLIDGYASNQKALEGAKAALVDYMGGNGLRRLLTAMAELKLPQEAQIETTKNIASAYQHLKSDDIPGAIAMFEQLKAMLKPAEWAEIAKALGPALMQTIRDAVTGPEKNRLIDAYRALGIDVDAGVAAGIAAGSSLISVSLNRALHDAEVAARFAIASTSPSKLFAEKVGRPIPEGIAKGIDDGSISMTEAMDRLFSPASTWWIGLNATRDELLDWWTITGKRIGEQAAAAVAAGAAAVSKGGSPRPDLSPTGITNILAGGGAGGGGTISEYIGGGQTANVPQSPQKGDFYMVGPHKIEWSEWYNPVYGRWEDSWVQQYREGTPYVPFDQLAFVHKGEEIRPAWANVNGPGSTVAAGIGGGGGAGTVNLTIDMRGAQLTGTLGENESMMTRVIETVISRQLGRDAQIAGVRH